MDFQFAWGTAGDVFDSNAQGREDLKVLGLKIFQREQEVAQLVCQVRTPDTTVDGDKTQDRVLFVSYREQLIFTGVPVGAPMPLEPGVVEMTLVAYHGDVQVQLADLVRHLKVSPMWDPLFVNDAETDEVAQALDGHAQMVHWNRLTGDVELTGLCAGQKALDVTGKVHAGSLRVSVHPQMVDTVHVRLGAQWVQEATECVDLGPCIDQAFGGRFNSFNRFAPGAGWPPAGTVLNQSGYYVFDSSLEPTTPPAFQSARSQFVSSQDKVYSDTLVWNGDKTQVAFSRYWYKTRLQVLWHLHQPRREFVEFTVKSQAPGGSPVRRSKRLHLNLQPLVTPGRPMAWRPGVLYTKGVRVFHKGVVYTCVDDHVSDGVFGGSLWKHKGKLGCALEDPASASFFHTDRGRRALDHALEIARVHLMRASRVLEISLETDFETAACVTLDHEVLVRDPSLPGGQVVGKVVAYELMAQGDTGEQGAKITVMCSQGEVGHKGIGDYSDQQPQEGILNPHGLTPQDLVARIDVQGKPTDQLVFLEQPGVRVQDKLKALNGPMATGFQVHFKELHAREIMEHTIRIT